MSTNKFMYANELNELKIHVSGFQFVILPTIFNAVAEMNIAVPPN